FQSQLRAQITADSNFDPEQTNEGSTLDHFRLLQACDKLSLLTCVDFRQPSHLQHPLLQSDGKRVPVEVRSIGERRFVLNPYPLTEESVTFQFPARKISGKSFSTAQHLQREFDLAKVETLSVTVSTK